MGFPSLVNCIVYLLLISVVYGNFNKDIDVKWGIQNVNISKNGQDLQLTLNNASGSLIQSKQEFLFGRFDIRMKLAVGDTAGTVTTFYLHSDGVDEKHDEIDMEFLGNSLGKPYILHTNIFTQGKGGREQQFYLWFDPTADFYNCTIIWNPTQITIMVNGLPVRVFGNREAADVAYPNAQAMSVFSSLWNGEKWATQRGSVKIDWSYAPFVASISNLTMQGCVWNATDNNGSVALCSSPSSGHWWNGEQYGNLTYAQQVQLKWVRDNYLVYDYCKDLPRFNHTELPPECSFQIQNNNSSR